MVETFCHNKQQSLVVLMVIIYEWKYFSPLFFMYSIRIVISYIDTMKYKQTKYTKIGTYRLKNLLFGFI
jgi:hypothetical protein